MSNPAIKTQTILEDYLRVWVQSFLVAKRSENLSPHTIRYYRNNLKAFADYCDSQSVLTISQLSPGFLREFLLYLEEQGHNQGGLHGYYRSVKVFLRWYWDEMEPEGRNPIERVRAPKVAVEPIQGVTREEFDAMLSACEKGNFIGERDRAILMVLMDTGVRAEELCNIRLDDLNLPECSILVTQGKGRKPRTVFFGRATRKQLRRYLKHRRGNYLFPNQSGERLVYSALRQIIRRANERAGTEGISPHDFRRGFTIECLRKGMDLLTVSRLLGHTSLELLKRYAKQLGIDLMNNYRSVIDE